MVTPTASTATSGRRVEDRGAPAFVLPQFGIFAKGTHAHHFLELDLKPGVTADGAVSAFCRLATPDGAAGGVNAVVPFGAGTWRPAAPDAPPPDPPPFAPVTGPDGRPPPAPHPDAGRGFG